MKKYTCYVETSWCGEDNEYKFRANDINEAEDIAYDLAYNNFVDYDGINGVAEEIYGDEYAKLNDEEQNDVDNSVDDYFSYSVDEFTGTDEEFDKLDKELYFK